MFGTSTARVYHALSILGPPYSRLLLPHTPTSLGQDSSPGRTLELADVEICHVVTPYGYLGSFGQAFFITPSTHHPGPSHGWYLTTLTSTTISCDTPFYYPLLRHPTMASYLRSLFGGSSSSRKQHASFSDSSKPRRRSCSTPRSSGQESPPSTSSVGQVPRRKRSNSLSCAPSPSKGYSYASLPAHTSKYGRHHDHHSPEFRIVSYKYDRPAPYPIYLPTASPQSNHSCTSSSTSSAPDSSPKRNSSNPSHSSPRSVLKKTQSSPHAGVQHHVSFANPNRPEALHMHPLLASSRHHPAPIWYDVTFTPSSKSVIDRKTRTPIPAHTLSQPATDPAKLDKLVLRSNRLPWPVVVHTDGKIIMNLDLLYALHRALSTRVTHQEWEVLGHGTHAQLKATRAYDARCKKLGGGWEGGVKRIDWLGEKTFLIGVEVDKSTGEGKLVFGKP
ncbi:hypothetical protein F5146DRAFT_661337 [Armillaria mellea]|nr:hypothetical protein F5146DRAFT_661337 [Armillaria mellea]